MSGIYWYIVIGITITALIDILGFAKKDRTHKNRIMTVFTWPFAMMIIFYWIYQISRKGD